MNLRKLPPSMLLALGLSACGKEDPDVGPCLSFDPPTSTSNGTDGVTSTSGVTSLSTTSENEVGPCLDVGPCLFDVPPSFPDMGSGGSTDDTGTDTGTSSDGSSSGDSGGSTGGMMDAAGEREAALRRVLSRGTLPADVAARLSDPDDP